MPPKKLVMGQGWGDGWSQPPTLARGTMNLGSDGASKGLNLICEALEPQPCLVAPRLFSGM
jgi:hypothetical protein